MVIDEPVLHLASAAGLALLLGSAGVHKLRHWREFSVIFGDYNAALGSLLPAWIAGLLPVLELLAAGAVLASPWQPDAALPAVFLFGLYVAVLAVAARRGSSIADCGCHFSGRSQPPGRALVLRNLLLLLPALNLLSPMGIGRRTEHANQSQTRRPGAAGQSLLAPETGAGRGHRLRAGLGASELRLHLRQ